MVAALMALPWALPGPQQHVARSGTGSGECRCSSGSAPGAAQKQLLKSVLRSDLEGVKAAVGAKADPSAYLPCSVSYRRNSLHLACIRNAKLDIIEYLVKDCRVAVNIRDSRNTPALALAVQHAGLPAVRFLVEAKADIDASGPNPLMRAVEHRKVEVADYLIQSSRSCVNRREENFDNISPLHEAARRGSMNMVKCLVEAGADIQAFDDAGHTPLAFARETLRMNTALKSDARAAESLEVVEYIQDKEASRAMKLLSRDLPGVPMLRGEILASIGGSTASAWLRQTVK
eukprot:CAMPEP_0184479544 /NCGR_PEP_ID=MMETSP0113_2-20130426/1232_1 /TAXON_ID=91329 /ORGANISM="Norrisiella sphaerica, Strain BC52" /LENGTH=288 /DNA_ID=CAMNT_0026857655 /DNA_START=122 /DNA_END=989 /DNA_ORIENTATION=+